MTKSGKLFIKFIVEFPKVLGDEHKKYISKLIPNSIIEIEGGDDVEIKPCEEDIFNIDDLDENEINLEDNERRPNDFDPNGCATQ